MVRSKKYFYIRINIRTKILSNIFCFNIKIYPK